MNCQSIKGQLTCARYTQALTHSHWILFSDYWNSTPKIAFRRKERCGTRTLIGYGRGIANEYTYIYYLYIYNIIGLYYNRTVLYVYAPHLHLLFYLLIQSIDLERLRQRPRHLIFPHRSSLSKLRRHLSTTFVLNFFARYSSITPLSAPAPV